MKQQDLLNIVLKRGYIKPAKQPIANAIVVVKVVTPNMKQRIVMLRRVVRIEVRTRWGLGWTCISRSFYGKIGETDDTIRIGSTLFSKP